MRRNPEGVITTSQLREAMRAATRTPGPPVHVEANGDEAWVTIGNGDALRLVPAPDGEQTLRREGWRPRLAHVEALLAAALDLQGIDLIGSAGEKFDEALAEVRALLDGDTNPTEGLVRLSVEDFREIEDCFESVAGEGHDVDRDLLDRLRREVGA